MNRLLCVLLTVAAVAGCTGQGTSNDTAAPAAPTVGDQLAEWGADNADVISRIGAAMSDIAAAAGDAETLAQIADLAIPCRELEAAVDEARSRPPIPHDRANDEWQQALDDFGTGAPLCVDGALNFEGSTLERAVEYQMSGNEHLDNVTAIIASL